MCYFTPYCIDTITDERTYINAFMFDASETICLIVIGYAILYC